MHDSRVQITDLQTGETRPVEEATVSGLDEFSRAWKHNVDAPEPLSFSGWQMSDEGHPAGTGKPAYRLVHKTVRTIVAPQLNITFTNLQVRFSNASVTYGEPRFEGALPTRRAGHFLLPEWGELKVENGPHGYKFEVNRNVDISAHQADTPIGNFVEVLYMLDESTSDEYEDMLAAGRAGTAALTLMLDLLYGERLLGPVVTEEIGEVFDDWHWNRLLGGRTIAMESQAKLEHLDGSGVATLIQEAIAGHVSKSVVARQQLKLAAQWYWGAESQSDPVMRFISYWLALEALELGERSNIAPLKRTIASILGVEQNAIADRVGRLYGLRNDLVHGSERLVAPGQVDQVKAVAVAVLEYRSLGTLSTSRRAGLMEATLSPGDV